MKIFINPGHGGIDSGACGFGLMERDVAWNIGSLVEKYLNAAGYDTMLFQFDGLQEICDAANNYGADLFVSIHCNAANGYAQGTVTFYFEGSTQGQRLAQCIQNQIVQSLPVVDIGLRTKLDGRYGGQFDPYVVKHTHMPAVLVETAFIDNYDDAQLLRDRQDDFARAIARGVSDFYVK